MRKSTSESGAPGTAPKLKKKPPPTSSDGGDARRWRQNNGTPRRTVVLPHPFAPTIIVNGDSNSIACSLSGLKARMPLIASFSIWDMVASSLRALRWLCLNYGFSQLTALRRRLAAWFCASQRGAPVVAALRWFPCSAGDQRR